MFDSSIFLRTQTYIDRKKFFILFFQQIVACVCGGLCVCVDTKRFNEKINEEMPFAWKENPIRERELREVHRIPLIGREREREREITMASRFPESIFSYKTPTHAFCADSSRETCRDIPLYRPYEYPFCLLSNK
jgi:hypothetical protein